MKPPFTQQSSMSPMRYKLAGFATGSDFSRMACTKVKMATLAPMPSEMVRITVAAKPGGLPKLPQGESEVLHGRHMMDARILEE